MAYSFIIDKPKDLNKALAKVKGEIEKNKGSLTGDEKGGSISMNGVKGTYRVTAHAVEITITKKPIIVSNTYIEKEIRKAFLEVAHKK